MTFALVALLLASVPANHGATRPSASVCNRMTMDLTDVNFAGAHHTFALSGTLRPGRCAPLGGLPAGPYALRFIERSGQGAALCAREVDLSPNVVIWITPDDGSKCML